VLVIVSGLLPGAVQAAPINEITFRVNRVNYIDQQSPSPLWGSDAWSSGTTSFQANGYAVPGRIGMDERVTTGPPGGTDGEEARASTRTDDFLISGPDGVTTVTATIHFSTHVLTALSGGSFNNNAHAAQGWINLMYYDPNSPVATYGTCFDGNHSYSGTGFLSGFVAPGGDYPTSFTTTFPVGVPLTMILSLSASGGTYVGLDNAPGSAEANLSAEIGDASGHVMDLPTGFTVNCPSWGIVDNQLGLVAAVEPGVPTSSRFVGLSPNPTTGAATLTFALAREGAVDARVLDLAGRVVHRLSATRFTAGTHTLTWDGRDDNGQDVAPGVYFVRLGLERGSLTRRVVRVR
jgi:hypothetical protein